MKTFTGWRQVGQVLRWIRTQHGAALTRGICRYEDGRTLRTWEHQNLGNIVTCLHDPEDDDVRVHAAGDAFQLRLDTRDTQRILNVLAGLGLIPDRYARAYQDGQFDGVLRLADVLTDLQQTHEIALRASQAVKP